MARRIGEVFLGVSPDSSKFGLETKVAIARATRSLNPTIKIKPEIDTRSMRASIQRESVNTRNSFRGMQRSMEAAISPATAFGRALRLVKFPALIAGANAAVGALGALSVGLVEVGASLAPLAGLLPAVGVGALAFGQAQGVLALASAGVGKALKAQAAGGDAYKKALDALTPAARQFVVELDPMRRKLDGLKQTAGSELFPGVIRGLRLASPLMDSFEPVVAKTARTMGWLAFQAGKVAGSGPFRRDFATIAFGNVAIIRNLGLAAITAGRGLAGVLAEASPLAVRLSRDINLIAIRMNAWIMRTRESGKMAEFFGRTLVVTEKLATAVFRFGHALGPIFAMASSSGSRFVDMLVRGATAFDRWTHSVRGMTAIRKVFDEARPVLQSLGRLIVSIAHNFAGLGAGLSGAGLARLIDIVATKAVPAFAQLAKNTGGAFLKNLVTLASNLLRIFAVVGGNSGTLTSFVGQMATLSGWLAKLMEMNPALGKFVTTLIAFVSIGKSVGLFSLISGFTQFTRTARSLTAMTAATEALNAATNGTVAAQKRSIAASIAQKVWAGIVAVATRTWAAAQWLLNTSFLGFPLVWIVAAIAAVVAGVILAYKHTAAFRNIVHETWQGVKWAWKQIAAVFAPVGAFIRDEVLPRLVALRTEIETKLRPKMAEWADIIKKHVQPALNDLKEEFKKAWPHIKPFVEALLQLAASGVLVNLTFALLAFTLVLRLMGPMLQWDALMLELLGNQLGFVGWVANKAAVAVRFLWQVQLAWWHLLVSIGKWLAGHLPVFGGFAGILSRVGAAASRLRPAFAAALGPIKALASGAVSSLGKLAHAASGLLAPAFRAMGTAARGLMSAVGPAFSRLRSAFTGVRSSIGILWRAFSGNFQAIRRVVVGVVGAIAGPAFRVLRSSFGVVRGAIGILWRTFSGNFQAIRRVVVGVVGAIAGPAFRALRGGFSTIRTGIGTLWRSFSGNFQAIRRVVVGVVGTVVGTAFRSLRNGFSGVRTALASLWRFWSGIFRSMGSIVGRIMGGVRKVFNDTQKAIGIAWNKIKGAVKAPINFVIDPVYRYIRAFWNAIAGKIPGMGTLPKINKFATGGIYPGYTPGRDVGLAAVSGGEAIMRPEWTRFMGAQYVHAANRAARGGTGSLARFLGGYKDGGITPGKIVTNIGHFFGNAKDFVLGNLLKVAGPVIAGIRTLINKIPVGKNRVGEMARGLPTKALDFAIKFIKGQDEAPVLLGGVGWNDGPLGGAVPFIINLMKRSRIPYGVSSTTRNEPGSWHGTGNAVDFVGPNMTKIARYWMGYAGALLELIHSPSWFVKNGRKVGANFYRSVYAQHFNHVHVAAKKDPIRSILSGVGAGSRFTGSHAALMIRALSYVKRPTSWMPWLDTLIRRESGWNPNAINRTDINARRGDPSRGLMQLIGATFRHWRLRKLSSNIYNPLANIVAGLRYIIGRYGSIFSVQQANKNMPPHGYRMGGIVGRFDNGGWLPPKGWGYNGTNKPELMTPADTPIRLHKDDLKLLAGMIADVIARGMSTFGTNTAVRANMYTR